MAIYFWLPLEGLLILSILDFALQFFVLVTAHARWRQDWVKVSSELPQDRRAWSASVRDVVNAIGDAFSTRPG